MISFTYYVEIRIPLIWAHTFWLRYHTINGIYLLKFKILRIVRYLISQFINFQVLASILNHDFRNESSFLLAFWNLILHELHFLCSFEKKKKNTKIGFLDSL